MSVLIFACETPRILNLDHQPRVVLSPSSYYPLPQRQPSGELLMSKIIFACFWIFCKWNHVLISFLPLSLNMISVSSFRFVACSIRPIGYMHYVLFMQSSVNRLLICWDKNGTTSHCWLLQVISMWMPLCTYFGKHRRTFLWGTKEWNCWITGHMYALLD